MKLLLASPGISKCSDSASFTLMFFKKLDSTLETISKILERFNNTIMRWSLRLPRLIEVTSNDSEDEDDSNEEYDHANNGIMFIAAAAGRSGKHFQFTHF